MSLRALAAELNAHASQVSDWLRRGMPGEPGAAKGWIAANIKRRKYETGPASLNIFDGDTPEAHADEPMTLEGMAALCVGMTRGFDAEIAALPGALDKLLAGRLKPAGREAVQAALGDWLAGFAARRAEGFL